MRGARPVLRIEATMSSDPTMHHPGADVRAARVFETTVDCPVLIADADASVCHPVEGVAPRLLKVGDVDVAGRGSTDLPGIRVGDGEGSGYVFRRALDGQFVFVPDAGYAGVTTFPCTVEYAGGAQATLLTSVNVRQELTSEALATFADGSCATVVTEGLDAAILGALSISGMELSEIGRLQVFEGGATTPSDRLAVLGDKLIALEPLSHAVDGTLHVRVVAVDAGHTFAVSELAVEVRPTGQSAEASAASIGPGIASLSRQDLLLKQAALDRFEFLDAPLDRPTREGAVGEHKLLNDETAPSSQPASIGLDADAEHPAHIDDPVVVGAPPDSAPPDDMFGL